MKKQLPLFLAFLAGVAAIVTYFLPASEQADKVGASWMIIIAAFALLLGILSLFQVNLGKVLRGHKDAPYASVLLLALVLTAGLGVLGGTDRSVLDPANPAWNDVFKNKCFVIFDLAIKPMQQTMFSLLAFFIASAAFRAFRVRSFEAGLLLVSAFVVMLGRIPIGGMIHPALPEASSWIMNTITMAGNRAILFGVAIGSIAISLKIILGIERGYMGGGSSH